MGKKSLLRNSAIYSTIMLLQKGINFFLIPILTIYLTPFDYGIVAVVMAINTFLNVFYLLALNGSLNRFYYEFKEDEGLVKRFFGTIVTFVLFNSFIVSAIIFLGRRWLLEPFLVDVEFFPYMFLGLISVIFNPCYLIYQNSLQARQEGVRYGKNNIAFFVFNMVLLLVGVIVFDLGAKGVLGALAITNIVFFVYTLFSFKKDLIFGIDKKILRKAIKYSFPVIPHTLAGVATSLIDRLLINKILSTSLAGIYSIGNNFGAVVFLLASGINQAFVPWFNQKIKENSTERIPEISRFLIVIYCLIALGLSFFGREIILLITPKAYHKSWIVIPFISFAYVYHGVYYFFASSLFYDIQGRGNRIIPVATILSALLNILLNLVFIPLYDILGAALATFLSKLFLTIFLSFVHNKYLNVGYPIRYMLLAPLGFFTISLLSYSWEFSLPFLLFKALIFILVLSVSYSVFKSDIRKYLTEIKLFN
ncbi:lipopolysaccharide biosynthesis protein [Flagellimonas meridianipacifica]|uniref:O-antigen/teichoic acid export membrane protein n=1 Tax=Flagellimonas meridianipacifica TaxID=1080225 RepID=A0A2T0MH83_9FLAO|nr:oligosaccharide flippase family protein [Allomuricauda pacifica]PRX56933.1 O-antigen/teichoic acid export membrane protein [Allomuricauda pacifica]